MPKTNGEVTPIIYTVFIFVFITNVYTSLRSVLQCIQLYILAMFNLPIKCYLYIWHTHMQAHAHTNPKQIFGFLQQLVWNDFIIINNMKLLYLELG